MGIRFEAAIIFVNSIAASRKFYENFLEMEVSEDHGENIVFRGGLSIWQADHAHRIIFGEGRTENSSLGNDNIELYFETDNLEEARAKLEESAVRLIQEIHEEPWHQRTFRVADPDGHIVEIGEPMSAVIKRFATAGLTAEEIAKETSMPLETVHELLKNSGRRSEH